MRFRDIRMTRIKRTEDVETMRQPSAAAVHVRKHKVCEDVATPQLLAPLVNGQTGKFREGVNQANVLKPTTSRRNTKGRRRRNRIRGQVFDKPWHIEEADDEPEE